jgi:nucleotide-binding universal stress UspA family protein
VQGLYALPDGRLAVVDLALEDARLEAAQAEVRALAEELLPPAAGVPYVVHVIREDPAGAGGKAAVGARLCAAARAAGAAALVVAARTRGALAEALAGSVASWCAHHAEEVPVLVLHAQRQARRQRGGWLGGALARLVHGGGEQRADEGPEAAGGAVSTPEQGVEFMAQTPPEAAPLGAGAAPSSAGAGGRRVLVCVDASAASERACAWAAENMWAPGDTLHLLHVIPSLPTVVYGAGVTELGAPGAFVLVPDQPAAALAAAAERFMGARFEPALRAAGVHFVSEAAVEPAEGSVAGVGGAVARRAAALGAAAVVVGSKSRGGLGEAVTGSVAAYLCHHCPVPVAVLH